MSKVNTRELRRKLREIKQNLKRAIPKALNEAGEKVVDTILTRTSKGVGLRGRFKPYSPEYRNYRKKHGKGTRPNLKFSGDMLGDLQVKKGRTNQVLIGFKSRKEERKAGYNQKTRPFMGVKPTEEKFIIKRFKETIEKNL